MEEPSGPINDSPEALLRAEHPGDLSGRETFGRYRYQVKVAVSYWLASQLPKGGPTAVFLEHLEDVALAYPNKAVLAQVKTRKPGRSKWSFTDICGEKGGLDSLLRSYRGAYHLPVEFHLILEGEASTRGPGKKFFEDPGSADGDCRSELRSKLGASDRELDGWLPRLKIRPGSPRITEIDNRNIVFLAGLIPRAPYYLIEQTYVKLLTAAENAQEGQPQSLLERISLSLIDPGPDYSEFSGLTSGQLADLLPAKPASIASLGIHDGAMSDLERKLRLNNASDVTIRQAKEARALADAKRRLLLSGPTAEARYYDSLASSVRTMAEVLAAPFRDDMLCADRVFAKLIETEGTLRQFDGSMKFNGPLELVGVVCQESDECRFPWRVA